MEAKPYLSENNMVGAREGWVVSVPATTLCLSTHKLQSREITWKSEGSEGVDSLSLQRPAAAIWGDGLWGSVGAAGRSYD
jgi:hypothetical protein